MSRLADQVKQAVAAFTGCKTTPALIGGLALAAHQVVRGTRDVDFLADANDADRLHDMLTSLGYRCIHRSEDAANYVRDDEGLDLIYAHRPTARRLLGEASERDTPMGPLRVVSAEALIGLKMNYSPKSTTNRPDHRHEPLIGKNVRQQDPLPVKSDLSDWIDLMEVIEALCPVWPAREPTRDTIYKL